MPKAENILDKSWKKGQSGNPEGRPKGSRNRSTIVKDWLSVRQSVKNPITGEIETLDQADMMTLALISKARKGDVQAFRELMDSGFGKIKDVVEVEKFQIQLTPEERAERIAQLKAKL